MGLREDKKALARQHISDVATALFLEKGFDAVSVADVAAAANVSKMTVFNYFPSKEDLLLDRGEEARALVRSAIVERASGQNAVDAAMDLAKRLVAEQHPFAKWTPGTERFLRMVRESPSLMARAREHRDLVEAEIVTALVESAGTRKPDVSARILAVSLVAAWVAAHATTTAALEAGKHGDALAKTFLRAFDEALEPIRRAARGTPHGSGRAARRKRSA